MTEQLLTIAQFMLDNLLRIWPYLLITIPIAVAVQMSGASKYIRRAFSARPVIAILLSTLVGAFSPFCSCSVIPLVASLLIGGVPLAPVMSFWIASPSMDPEAFFLSVSMLGWDLAIWRLGSTLAISLGAGLITHFLVERGWLGDQLLRTNRPPRTRSWMTLIRSGWAMAQGWILNNIQPRAQSLQFASVDAACCSSNLSFEAQTEISSPPGGAASEASGLIQIALPAEMEPVAQGSCQVGAGSAGQCTASAPAPGIYSVGFLQRLGRETVKAVVMIVQFMALAFFLEAVIQLYVPQAWIAGVLGSQNPLAILTAALLGVPVYTSNLAALPLVGGLLGQGMSPAAGLAFLIAGPTTTLPAMSAVWGLVSRRVFVLYVALSLLGAIVLGYLYEIVMVF